MSIADTDLGIESQLIDLSGVSFSHLRGLNSSVFRQAMNHVMDRTGKLRDVRSSTDGGDGQRD
jgi:hypothetical protein